MYIEKATIYEDKQHWGDADIQYFASYPRADANLRFSIFNPLTEPIGHIHVQGSGSYGFPGDQSIAYTTLTHEFGHYALGASDEYYYREDGDNSNCTLLRTMITMYEPVLWTTNTTQASFAPTPTTTR